MSPMYTMPDPVRWRREATLADAHGALSAARCAVELAGWASRRFVTRELLLVAIQQIDRAIAALGRLS